MRMGGLAAFLDERTEQAARGEAGGGGMGGRNWVVHQVAQFRAIAREPRIFSGRTYQSKHSILRH